MSEPRLPKVGEYIRSVGVLVAIEEIPPKPVPPQIDYIFEQTEARCEMRFKGKGVNVIQTLWDHAGQGSAVKTAIEDMKSYAKREEIDPSSDIEVVVVEVKTQYRFKPKDRECFYDRQFFGFDSPRS